jgi:cation/acetate symporter
VLQPGLLFTDFISSASLTLAFLGGTAGMPHVIMRFFTVPNGQAARASAGIALTLITFFHLLVAIIGFGAIAILVDHSEFSLGGTALVGGDNMAAIHLAGELGGDLFLGFLSAVIFMTILAVVCGLTLAISATVSHDLFANVFRGGNCSERQELWINRVTLACLTVVVILLGTLLEGQNVAVLVTLSLAISASTNFPLLALAMYWRKFTTRGLVAGGLVGLIFSVGLVILSPFIWVNVLKNESAAFPYAYPTLFSMSASFIFAWLFSVTDRSVRGETERQLFDAQEFRSLLGTTTADPLR